jgi:Fe2+ or Zn2+ uptake regulation protein
MKIENFLKQNAKRITPERIAIFEFLQTQHIFTYNDIILHFSDISRASVFRTLNLFFELGVIRKVEIGEKTMTYELNNETHHHEHMKCNKCGVLINFPSESICEQIFKEAKKIGFEIKSHNIGIMGICKNCLIYR